MNRTIREASPTDMAEIMKVMEAAKGIMRQSGNMHQWGEGYPSEAIIITDMEKHGGFVIEDCSEVVGYFALLPSPEPTYHRIYEGLWTDDASPYHVVHRIASYPHAHGIFNSIMDFCFSQYTNIRIDTHRDNTIMQHNILKHGFTHCGIIYLASGDERLAYQKVLEKCPTDYKPINTNHNKTTMVRKATKSDISRIICLLHQVDMVHHEIRPDLFKPYTTKYDETELEALLHDESKPIFVYDDGKVLGHAFCQVTEVQDHKLLQDVKTLYIDDICVDETARGRHVGKALYEHVIDYARSIDCHNVTLNVWEGNGPAFHFYQNMGMKVQKTGMEIIL